MIGTIITQLGSTNASTWATRAGDPPPPPPTSSLLPPLARTVAGAGRRSPTGWQGRRRRGGPLLPRFRRTRPPRSMECGDPRRCWWADRPRTPGSGAGGCGSDAPAVGSVARSDIRRLQEVNVGVSPWRSGGGCCTATGSRRGSVCGADVWPARLCAVSVPPVGSGAP
jgi:hypothetical protein